MLRERKRKKVVHSLDTHDHDMRVCLSFLFFSFWHKIKFTIIIIIISMTKCDGISSMNKILLINCQDKRFV